ncbi:biotin-dependent carboxyltransferase family protein [Dyella sp. S184]|uniref:5-oxoprolinase subunit C family protein n=1 Tax=Dyella sp. S184 TaxID=1641862 RepID=UPI00131D2EE7|nr:biotin-dependent carboxyltransferase family protein [Dyella sp. S184]
MNVTVIKPGLLSSLQDAGRPGHAALGVGRTGAMDPSAWQLANALVGNAGGEAAIECTLTGPSLRFEQAAVIALTGAPITARVGEHSMPMWTTCHLPAGSVLHLGGMASGCRSYLAVRGGFHVEALLGSRSSDLHARIGYAHGRALCSGDVLPIGATAPLPGSPAGNDVQPLGWSLDPQPWFDFAQRPLALLRGSHWAQLDTASQQLLFGGKFSLSKDSNRTASRLDGHTLKLRAPLELISEAALPGTVQLPPSGQPIALLAEAPVTGGYPRIGQIAAVDLPGLAQRRPGNTVCFRETTLDEALMRLAARRQRLTRLLGTIAQRLEHR